MTVGGDGCPDAMCPQSLEALALDLARFCAGDDCAEILPWAEQLSAQDRDRLRHELELLLAEPAASAEPLDWPEVLDVLTEYAAVTGSEGPAMLSPPPPPPPARFAVKVRAKDLRALERTAPAVQEAVRHLLECFLPLHPTDADRLERGALKKLSNRDIWQIRLPDGYRLRYFLAEPERTVHVVYLGRHPDGDADGREQSVRASVRRRRFGDGAE
jgi:mRNA-degrading endonuclease RelE of RelBE toxin-antitoxin system